MKRFTILIDMDDTLESLVPAWVGWLNASHGLSVDPASITEWDIRSFFPSLSEEEVFRPLSLREFWATVLPKPGAVEYVRRLIDDGHKVYVCTASHYQGLRDKMDVALFSHFPYIGWSNVIVAYDKSMIRGDFIIDDALHNLENRPDDTYAPFLMDAPHNQKVPPGMNVIRVFSWEEIYRKINEAAHQSRE